MLEARPRRTIWSAAARRFAAGSDGHGVGGGLQLVADGADRGADGGRGVIEPLGRPVAAHGGTVMPTKMDPSRTGPSTTARKAVVSRPRSVTHPPGSGPLWSDADIVCAVCRFSEGGVACRISPVKRKIRGKVALRNQLLTARGRCPRPPRGPPPRRSRPQPSHLVRRARPATCRGICPGRHRTRRIRRCPRCCRRPAVRRPADPAGAAARQRPRLGGLRAASRARRAGSDCGEPLGRTARRGRGARAPTCCRAGAGGRPPGHAAGPRRWLLRPGTGPGQVRCTPWRCCTTASWSTRCRPSRTTARCTRPSHPEDGSENPQRRAWSGRNELR